jgi:hypothetical protein
VFEINSSGVSTFQKAVHFAGSTPTVTVGDGGAEDAKILFDGNEQNFHIGLDDSTNKLTIGLGNNLGTYPGFTMDENTAVEFPDNTVTIISSGNHDMLTLKSTDADAGVGPVMAFVRDSASPDAGDFIGAIVFDADDSGGNSHQFVEINAVMQTATNGSEDGRLRISSTVGGTNRNRLDFLAGETVFNEDSVDVDFRVESNGNANMLFVDAGNDRIGIGTNSPSQTFSVAGNMDISATSRLYLDGGGDTFIEEVSGNTIAITTNNTERMRFFSGGNISIGSTSDPAKLTVRTSDSTAGPNSDADELFLESNGNAGMTIGSSTSTSGNIHFADNGAANRGIFSYDHSADSMKFGTAGAIKARFTSGGALSLNDSSPDVSDNALCINQGANDGLALSFKSSDVAHGITSGAETDTYFKIAKNSAASGGVDLFAYSERTDGEYMRIGLHGNGISDTKSTSGVGALHMFIGNKSGTNIAGLGTNDNMITIAAYTNTRFIFDAEGDFHADSSSTTFDAYDDAQLVRAYDLSHGKGVINSKFDKFIEYNHEKLANLKLVGREEDGTPNNMVSVTGMQRLHNGAIWQQYEKHEKLASAFYKLAKKTIGKEEADKLLTEEEIQLLN